ncbi:MAG: flagellar biosynthesis repressor FlbT, partial [Proteobacteria bacterium]|nr:flagellar biosynthesis repressor FlbT [Pseudomonadota bacterium]
MPLKITLKPNERLIIAGAIIRNGNATTRFLVENTVPILREKDIMREAEANSPARRIYYVIQLIYVDPDNLTSYHGTYWNLVRDFMNAVPSSLKLLDDISENILSGNTYKALRLARKLMAYETEILA